MEGTLLLSTAPLTTTITKTPSPSTSCPQSFRPRRITTTATNALFQRSSVHLKLKSSFLSPVLCVSSSNGGDISSLSSDVILLDVKGMMCGGCTSSVKRILENQAQVSSADVDLATETATVWPVSEAKVTPNWQKVVGEELAKNLTNCGFNSTLKGFYDFMVASFTLTMYTISSDLARLLLKDRHHRNAMDAYRRISYSLVILRKRLSINQFERKVEQKQVFELHMEELRAIQEEILKRDKEITLLKTVVQSLGGNDLRSP
ncbi:heavy metal-associated domain, HMA [Artemisia annua]|uniref:Heavy metal-associated domain, HMA n=1 Tax=Artemisia annua TaxID=35608 RepID=A0A2U1P7F1_ARTAN|nr:heavy metal-associated domain, HMA [Artemisia annua]